MFVFFVQINFFFLLGLVCMHVCICQFTFVYMCVSVFVCADECVFRCMHACEF